MSIKNKPKYKITVGVETHVQLKTKTKLFAAVGNDARNAKPNTLISHICLGMPGALPVLNEHAIELAMQAAFAVGSQPKKFSKFDRKHYFYPDLPKGYQITQYDQPIIEGGYVKITANGKSKKIGIVRAHLEEDAGKTTHPAGKDYSLVDLNRAGTPLLEIVSQPDINSAAEAKAYARELWLLMRYADVSDADLYHGNMRFDVNVSVSDSDKLGTRSETKNLNSFKSVEKAVDYEAKRQIELLEKGKTVTQETRGWDDSKQKTFSQRGKEEAHDYRYFPEPDVPPVVLSDTAIEEIKKHMPPLPGQFRTRLHKLGIDDAAVETLLDEMPASSLIIELLDDNTDQALVRKIANWLVTDIKALVVDQDKGWDALKLNPTHFIELAEMTNEGKLSSTAAKTVLVDMVQSEDSPVIIAEAKNLLQVSDEDEIANMVDKIIKDNPKAAEDIKNGEMKAVGFLVGQVMKLSQGKANPGVIQKLIRQKLKN